MNSFEKKYMLVVFLILLLSTVSTTALSLSNRVAVVTSQAGTSATANTVNLPLIIRGPRAGESCPDWHHDRTKWHPLIDPATGCHYDHEHKANPHVLDEVFGTWLYERAGGSISFPWQTTNENENKHEVYAWFVAADLDPSQSDDGRVFVKNIRAQIHAGLSALGAPVRFHSNYIEAEICLKANPGDCGILRYGGHIDYGELRLAVDQYDEAAWLPLDDIDPIEYDGVEPPAIPEREYDAELASRVHSSLNDADPNYGPNLRVSWNGRFGGADPGDTNDTDGPQTPNLYSGFNHFTEDAGAIISYDDPRTPILTGGDNSTHFVRSFVLRISESFVENGRINWSGHTDRFGVQGNPDCSAPGPNCVPTSYENVPMMSSNSLFVHFDLSAQRDDYDTTDEDWLDYPN